MHVAGGVEQKALGRRSVASGAPGLLVVVLQAARDVVVDDVVDVRLVDAHAEGVRGDHHAGAVVEEVILVAVALCCREACVVARRSDAARAQKLAELLDGLAARAVDDTRLVLALARERDHTAVLGLAVGRPLHEELEVRPIEARKHGVGVAQAEGARDVVAHGLRGRRGERHHRRASGHGIDELDDPLVRRPEVIAPLADAVRLVDGKKGDAARRGDLEETRVVQALGRDVHERERAGRHTMQDVGLLGGGKRRVEATRRDAALPERPHLVCHERDQGRDDHRETSRALGKRDGGHLVADRLAR